MGKFVDGLALGLEHFAGGVKTSCSSCSSISFVNPYPSHEVTLNGRVAKELPEKFQIQSFDDSYLQPIALELGISLHKLAELLAIRNSWIGYIQEYELSNLTYDEIRILLTNDIGATYLLLTSNKWFEHPWMQAQINQSEIKDIRAIAPRPLSDPDEHETSYYQSLAEGKENDIHFLIGEFESQRNSFTSSLEMYAEYASHDIKRAQKKILDLHTELELQESIIRSAMKPILKYKKSMRLSKNQLPGRPKKTEEQKWRYDLGKKFVVIWINSLMEHLRVDNCSELAKLVGGQKMTWWRWRNNETLPPLRLLYQLLNSKVKSDGQKAIKLGDIQTTPSLKDLVSLIELI